IKKSVVFLLPTSVTEAMVIALAIVIGYQLPMTPAQILWINMITAVTLGVALAFEPGNPDVMRRSPRATQEPLLTPLVIWRTVFVSVLMLIAISWVFMVEAAEHNTEYARTAAVNTLVMFEAVYLVSARHLHSPSFVLEALIGNRMVVGSILVVGVFQLLFTYTEPFQRLFESRPLTAASWYQIGALSLILFAIVEIEKLVRRWLAGISS
ncbi:MAG: cation transporting ATPase C-terminal domain-containing protein, partial [Gammaproteobacteria bacterium]|nr:cation transporting ATPase C-terminal domain-containing protein [Gammaproteobacteria bacterium]